MKQAIAFQNFWYSYVIAFQADFVDINDGDMEHCQRIRNKLYHEGTGLSVNDRYLKAYRSIAALLLENLFDVKHSEPVMETETVKILAPSLATQSSPSETEEK